ncbi:MAG: sugar phosphate isomerase/epimerase [Lautropia sp.]|nr:sugar phosphate isomerase/epimerase [Lautropia sp.]
MRLGVSNLLWTRDLDEPVAALLDRRGIDTIDLAPTRYFDDPAAATPGDLRQVRGFWASRGIAITGLQALMHGTTGLNIFGDRRARRRTLEHLRVVMNIGAGLGATQLIFGSSRNRDRGALAATDAMDSAAEFFGGAATEAAGLGVCLTIEPISARYGNNFLVDHDEAARLVERVGHPAFRLTLDIGCLGLAGEDTTAVMQRHASLISHVQLAEYQLQPLSADNPLHAIAGPIVAAGLPGRVACIEALKPPDNSSIDAIAQSLDVAQLHYG